MVYIHGGGFSLHSAKEYPPIYLMERDIVLVIIQYRLDALGIRNMCSFTQTKIKTKVNFWFRFSVNKLQGNSR